jgi:proteasome lid subunit RPN8/RPN11
VWRRSSARLDYWEVHVLVTEEMVREIARYGTIRKPNEACGLILGDRIIELRNASQLDRTWNYWLGLPCNILSQLRIANADLTQFTAGNYIIWHTHPQGLIGPSPGDMETKIKGVEYLVVTLTEDGPMAARF